MNNEKNLVLLNFKPGLKFIPSKQLVRRLSKKERWVLDNGKYAKENCKKMFEAAEEAAVIGMWLGEFVI